MKLIILIFAHFMADASELGPKSTVVQFIADFISSSERFFPSYNLLLCDKIVKDVMMKLSSTSIGNPRLSKAFDENQFMEFIEEEEGVQQGYIVNMDCFRVENLVEKIKNFGKFEKRTFWLFLMTKDYPYKDDPYFGLEGLYFRLDSLVIFADLSDPDHIHLTEMYKIRENLPMIKRYFGHWKIDDGIKLSSLLSIVLRRSDLMGIEISASIVIANNDTWNHLEDMYNPVMDSPSRFIYALEKAMMESYNASLTLVPSPMWGGEQNGTWVGMLGHLYHRDVDLACGNAFITKERQPFFDFIHETPESYTGIILSMPPLSYSHNLFTLPFSRGVWYCCIAFVVTMCLMLYIAQKIEFNDNASQASSPQIQQTEVTFSDVIMLNLGAICQQGWDPEPKGLSGRIITILLYIAVMALHVSYSASIVGLLQASDTSIKTLKDLSESSIQVGAEDIDYHRWIQHSKDPYRRAIYRKKLKPKPYITIEEGISRLKKGPYAFHVEVSRGYLIIQSTFNEPEKCVLSQLPALIETPRPQIGMPKGTQFVEHFKIGLRRIRDVGIKSRAARRLYQTKPPCTAKGQKFVNVGLIDCYRIFLVLAYSMIASIILLIIENIVAKRCAKLAVKSLCGG